MATVGAKALARGRWCGNKTTEINVMTAAVFFAFIPRDVLLKMVFLRPAPAWFREDRRIQGDRLEVIALGVQIFAPRLEQYMRQVIIGHRLRGIDEKRPDHEFEFVLVRIWDAGNRNEIGTGHGPFVEPSISPLVQS